MADGQTTAEAPVSAPATPDPAEPTTGEAPPWGEDFDPARAWKTIQALRESEKTLKGSLTAYEKAQKEREDAEKTEAQKAAERAAAAEEKAAAATRELLVTKAGLKHSIPEDLLDLIGGTTAEEIEERAARLAERLKAANPSPTPPARPEPRLTPGSDPTAADGGEFDPEALAARIRRGQR